MEKPEYVIVLGKAMTGLMCPWDDPTVSEFWGVNNVAEHPENIGCVNAIGVTNFGERYTHAEVEIVGGGGWDAKAVAEVKDGKVAMLKIVNPGGGYESVPKVIIKGDGRGATGEVLVSKKHKFHKLFAFDELPKEYTDKMKKFAPVVSVQDYADIPYPLKEVQEDFGIQDYYTNTVSYMIALCAHWRIKKLGIYGVDVAFGAPYAQENRGVEFWMGVAHARGIKIEAPPQSQLMKTLSGVRYGVKDHCNVPLYLHERINLINTLPRKGNYSTALKAQNAWWVLFPKEDEARAHGVQVQRAADGTMSFGFKDRNTLVAEGTPNVQAGEFISDVHMPPETWEFLRDILRDKEKNNELDFGALTAYEKLILSKPDGGN